MSVITISRLSCSGGETFGQRLADELGYTYLDRSTLIEKAESMGVPVTLLFESIEKPRGVVEHLRSEHDKYIACLTMLLCEEALKGKLVYSGHAGHMLLLGIPGIIRLKIISDLNYRLKAVMKDTGLSRSDAKKHITKKDDLIDRWGRYLYTVDWHNPHNFDMVISLSESNADKVLETLVTRAKQPDNQLDANIKQSLEDLRLASKAHFYLMQDPRTSAGKFIVTSDLGSVQVTSQPRFSDSLAYAPDVLSEVDGIKDIHVTIAFDTILYIGERFDPKSEGFQNTIKMSKRRNWAVELVSMPAALNENELIEEETDHANVEEEIEQFEKSVNKEIGLSYCLEHLREAECCAGSNHIYATPWTLVRILQRRHDYKLVVIGSMFQERSEVIRKRFIDNLKTLLSENVKIPVIEADEIDDKFRFTKKLVIKTFALLVMAAVLVSLVLMFYRSIIDALYDYSPITSKGFIVLIVMTITPLFAYLYGSFTGYILKWLHID
jgi:cytidylate kinase